MRLIVYINATLVLFLANTAHTQSLITSVDRNLSNVPTVYAADVAPGGIIGYNEKTHEIFYEGRSAKAKTLLLEPDSTYPFPKETIDKSRAVDIGLAFFGQSLSAGLKWTNHLEVSGGEFTVHRFVPDPNDAPKPFDVLVYQDKETVDTAYDGYMKWKHWNAYVVEAVYKTKSLTISKTSSVGVKLSNGDTPPDCITATADPKQKDNNSDTSSEVKKSGTTKDAGNSAVDPKQAASTAQAPSDSKPEKPDTSAKTADKNAAAANGVTATLKACFNSDRELVISSKEPAVSAIKILELVPDATKPLGFDYRPTTAVF
jgi:hypothetical protein